MPPKTIFPHSVWPWQGRMLVTHIGYCLYNITETTIWPVVIERKLVQYFLGVRECGRKNMIDYKGESGNFRIVVNLWHTCFSRCYCMKCFIYTKTSVFSVGILWYVSDFGLHLGHSSRKGSPSLLQGTWICSLDGDDDFRSKHIRMY